jgi:hypothetical protein
MSGPIRSKQVSRRDAEDMKYDHIRKMRFLADSIEEREGMFGQTREGEPDLSEADSDAIAALLRAKADKIESHLDAIDAAMNSEFHDLLKAIEWRDTGDYGLNRVREEWESYGEVIDDE